MTLLHIKDTSFVSSSCREDFFMYFHYKSMVDNDMPGAWTVWTPGAPLAGFIKKSNYTLLHTKYESSGPYGFGEEDVLRFSNCKCKEAIGPLGFDRF